MSDHGGPGPTGEPSARRRPSEVERLAELHDYQVLDTEPEAAFDGLVRAAAVVAGVPIALVSLVDKDRQWFKANLGIDGEESDRESAFCDHVVQAGAEMVVPDTAVDPRFVANPLVTDGPKIAFYAGFPLEAPSGAVLGTLCVIDRIPRTLTEDQKTLLRTLAEQVMTQLRLRRELIEREAQLAERNRLMTRLTESELRFRSLIEHSTDVIGSHNPDFSVKYASPSLKSVLGIDPEAAAQSNLLSDRLHPDDRARFAEAAARTSAGRESIVTGRMQHASGVWRHMEIKMLPILDAAGAVQEILSTGRDVTDRVEADLALRAANDEVAQRREQLEEAQRLAGVGSFTYDVASREITWSRELKRIFGEPDDFEPTFDSYRERIHPDDREVLTGSVNEAMANGTFYEVEHRLIRPDGEERILLARGRVELDLDGTALYLHGMGQDVTEARHTKQVLSQTTALFAQVLGATEQSIIATTPDLVISLFNRGAELMLGYTAAEVVGICGPEIFHDPQEILDQAAEMGVEPGRKVFTHHVDAGQSDSRRWTYIRKDGARRTVQLTITAMRDPDGEVSGYIGVATDITDQQTIERERDDHAMMLRAVIENNQSIIYVRDLDGRYLMVNRAFEEAFDVRERDLLGLDAFSENPRAQVWQANNMRAVEGPYRVEEVADLPDGRHWFDAVKVPLRDRDGVTYAICGLSLDVTERRRAEAEVAKAVQAMALARDAAIAATKAKSAFLATMSHEIRTPMNAVIGMTGLLLDSDLTLEQRDLLETVRTSGDQLLVIINDILDFSKIESGELDLEEQPFDLRECIEGTMALFGSTAGGLDLVSHLAEECPRMVVGDVTRLRQVMVNLVGNAVKFTQVGHVLLRVEPDPRGRGPVAGTVRLRFTVADSGIGISESSMDRLFKSFSQVDASTTRMYGGTGLGLAISKAIVEAMDGEVSVSSTPGVGSEFAFTVTLGEYDGPQPLPGAPGVELTGRRALIVDDNDTNRRILRLQLESCGMVCTDTGSPLEGLSLIGQGIQFDVAVLDFAMPIMDGVQLALALRQLPGGRGLPLMLLSSIGRRERNDPQLFAAVLTKPTRSTVLIETVSQVLAGAPVPDVVDSPPPATVEPAASATAPMIPAPAAAEAATERASAAVMNEGSTLRILLAEDNEVNQKVGRLMLGKLGHRVDIAGNGQEALDAARRTPYDIILMDMHMPVMDGLEATRRIRAELPADRQPHIIAMTASVTQADRQACTEAGMDGYLPKPVRADALAEALATLPQPSA